MIRLEPRRRKNIRLREYDYSQTGAYFITVCTENRRNMLAVIHSSEAGDRKGRPYDGLPDYALTELGEICKKTLHKIKTNFHIGIPIYVIMPNHIHVVLYIKEQVNAVGATLAVAHHPTTGIIIGCYKSMVSTEWLIICKERGIQMGQIWQRSYYDRIIRNEDEYWRICNYIDENPTKWCNDEYFNDTP